MGVEGARAPGARRSAGEQPGSGRAGAGRAFFLTAEVRWPEMNLQQPTFFVQVDE